MIITIGSVIKDENDNIYKLTEIIGQGGFSTVYKAIRESDSKLFAVKTLLQSFSGDDDFQSFKNEVLLAQIVSGENIINYEYVHNGEAFNELPPYIIMEYCDYTLDRFISENNTKLTLSFRKQIALQFLNTLKYLYSKELLHRDLSYRNILLKKYDDVIEREFGAFDSVRDPSPKYVFSLDEYDMSKDGITHFNIEDWLLNKVDVTLS